MSNGQTIPSRCIADISSTLRATLACNGGSPLAACTRIGSLRVVALADGEPHEDCDRTAGEGVDDRLDELGWYAYDDGWCAEVDGRSLEWGEGRSGWGRDRPPRRAHGRSLGRRVHKFFENALDVGAVDRIDGEVVIIRVRS